MWSPLLGDRALRTTRQRRDRLTFDNHALHSLVTTFSDLTSRSPARVSTMPLPAFVAGAPADVRGTLVAVHFRDERGFAIFLLGASRWPRGCGRWASCP